MRVAEVLTASTGGIGRHVAGLAPRLAALGHDVQVLCPPVTAAAHDLGGVAVQPLSGLARVRVDLLHAHGYKAGALALPVARARRIPLVVTWHNAVLGTGPRARAGRLLQRLVARGADLTLGASSDLVATACALGARQAELAPVAAPVLPPPAVPRERYRAELGVDEDTLLVVTVARLAPQKDLGTVLDVAAALADRPGVQFAVAGDGPLRDELAARIRREDLRVRLLGGVRDVASLLGAADVMLLTSRWEARALVAQEALRAGLPLFSTRVGGIAELVGEAAVLFPPGDAAAAAAALADAADHRERLAALARAGARRAAGWPDEDAVARRTAALYTQLVTAARRSRPAPRPT